MPDHPLWLSDLTDALATRLIPFALDAPVGVHLQPADPEGLTEGHTLEVSLFYGATEVLGGPTDGKTVHTPFWLDLEGVTELFDRVDGFVWQATHLGEGDDFGPHVAIEGLYRGRPVRVRVLSDPPPGFPPGRTADVQTGEFRNAW